MSPRFIPVLALVFSCSNATPQSTSQPGQVRQDPSTRQEDGPDDGHPSNASRITALRIDGVESPAFEGRTFGEVGPYQKVVGKLHGVIDPADPRNATITDLDKAPRNASGLVEYTTDFFLFAPAKARRGNGFLLEEIVNRGNRLMMGFFNRGGTVNEPSKASDAGDGFLFEQGFTLLWVGWQGDLNEGNGRVRLSGVPIATDGPKAINGGVRAEFLTTAAVKTLPLSSGSFTGTTHQSYPTASLDNSGATLTVRLKESDTRQPIAKDQWSFASCPNGPPGTQSATDICFGSGFQPGFLYELIYIARDPKVLGVGLAAVRDATIFFRTAQADEAGTPNPLFAKVDDDQDEGDGEHKDDGEGEHGGRVRKAILFGISQSGRLVRTFEQLGFNADAEGRKVFEAIWPHIGPGRNPVDVRFGQPGRAYGQHEDHLYPAYEFPFSYAVARDELVTHRTGSVLDRCREARNCPKVFHTYSATEYWQGKQSLDQVELTGTPEDLRNPENVRMYFIASTQHGPAATPAKGICQQLSNPAPHSETVRALLVDLRAWLDEGEDPPPDRVPRLADGTLVPDDPKSIGFPSIPGVNFAAVGANSAPVFDFGPGYVGQDERGVISIEPPKVVGSYPIFVAKTDADGNDLGGIRSTTLRAPLGTYTGWNLRRAGFAEGELCGLTGSFIPFAGTKAERQDKGDPRPSLAERFQDHPGYVDAVTRAADELVKERFLVPADRDRLIAEAGASSVLR